MKANQEQFQQFNQLSSVTHLSDEAAASCSGGQQCGGSSVSSSVQQVVMYQGGDSLNGPSGQAFAIYDYLNELVAIPNLSFYSMTPPPDAVNTSVTWSNQVSYIDVNEGSWQIYKGPNFTGESQVLVGPRCYPLDQVGSPPGLFNNNVESIRRVR
jgi:hypothetical protein